MAMDPYDRWVYLTKKNRDEGEIILRMSSKDENLSNEVKPLLRKLRNTFRDERNRMISTFNQRWDRAQAAQDLSSSLTPSQVSFAAFKTLSPDEKLMTFLYASESDREIIINSMRREDAVSFLEDCLLKSDAVKIKMPSDLSKEVSIKGAVLSDTVFPFNLKIKFMKKLLFSEYSKDETKIKEEKGLIKKFYNLLPKEVQASLREATKGGTVGVAGRPDFSYREYEPSEGFSTEEYHRIYEESKDPSEGYVEIDKRYRKDPNLLGEESQTKSRGKIPTDQLPILPEIDERKIRNRELDRIQRKTEEEEEEEEGLLNLDIETVNDIADDDLYIFQMLPRPPEYSFGSLYRWVLISAFSGNEPEYKIDEYADILEEKYKERMKDFKKEINESQMEGECIILDGSSAKELISSGMARISNKKFPGSVRLKGPEDMIGRGERSSSRLDPEKQEGK